MYLYQVTDPAGRVLMQTTDPRCTYAPDVERAIRRAGFRIKVQQDPADGDDNN